MLTLMVTLTMLGQLPMRGCDPAPQVSVEIPAPREKALRCGDGRVGGVRCTQLVGGGGCGVETTPSPVVCVEAPEVCDGDQLAGRSCITEGFSGGSLRCSATCELELTACEPCFESERVTCAEVPGAGWLSAGDDAGLVLWLEPGRLQGAVVQQAGLELIKEPLATWTSPEQTVTSISIAWVGRSWFVWYGHGGALFERRVERSGRLGAAQKRGDFVAGEMLQLTNSTGARFLVVTSSQQRLRVHPLGPSGLGAALALEVPLAGEAEGRSLAVVPFPGAGPGEADLAVVSVDPVFSRGTSVTLYREGRGFGGSLTDGKDFDATFKTGRLTLQRQGSAFVTTWSPTTGKPAVWERSHDTPTPEGLFARHASVTAQRFVQSVGAELGRAEFHPPGGRARVLVALRRLAK